MARPRRLLRFSLRSLLVLTLLVALFFAWFTPRLERARRQAAAVAALREANERSGSQWISFTYDYERGSRAKQKPPGPDWLRDLLGVDFFSDVVRIDWSVDRPTQQDLSHLRAFEGLHFLTLRSLRVDDNAVAALSQLNPSIDIDIYTAQQMTCAEMLQVEDALPNCWLWSLQEQRANFRDMARRLHAGDLRVFGSFFSTDQLLALTDMTGIRQLCVDRLQVEDASIDAFATMPWLQELIFWHADLSGTDLGRLDTTKRLARVAFVGPVPADVIRPLADVTNVTEVLYKPAIETQITPEEVQQALDVLSTFTHLEQLVLAGPMISAADVARVQAALPDVDVSYAKVDRLPDIREAFADDAAP